jgi:hypothetical protein
MIYLQTYKKIIIMKEQETQQPENSNEAPIATLLSSISYTNQADYEKFLENLTPEHALIILIASANHCQSKGVFTIEESELIAKSIRAISKVTNEHSDESQEEPADQSDSTNQETTNQ